MFCREDVITFINDILKNEIENLNIEMSELNLDSITFIQMIVAIENKFGIEFEDDYLSLDNISSFNDLVEYTIRLIEGKNEKIE